MSTITLIAENILNAIKAVDEMNVADKHLVPDVGTEKFDALRKQMFDLQERLLTLKRILDNEQAYAMDEIIDALSSAYSDHRPQYRRTPRMRG